MEIEETTLGANQLLNDVPEKLQWETTRNVGDQISVKESSKSLDVNNLMVELNPLQIRTFLITYTTKNNDDGGNDNDDDDGEEETSNSSKNTAVVCFVLIAALINYF